MTRCGGARCGASRPADPARSRVAFESQYQEIMHGLLLRSGSQAAEVAQGAGAALRIGLALLALRAQQASLLPHARKALQQAGAGVEIHVIHGVGYLLARVLCVSVFERAIGFNWLLGVASLLLSVLIAVIASIPPVRRATRIDPAIVLREE